MRKLGAFEILYELTWGGMGQVLLARRRGPGSFEQLVAIKTIRTELASADTMRAMFLDEAAILARISHPGIAAVYDFGEDARTLYMAMEYVAGLPLRDVVPLRPPPVIAARAIAEAARGLHAAHEARDVNGAPLGIVHRDISPDNLMLGFDGHVKVIDFGIALIRKRQSPVTDFGTTKGKPPYMSPEQLKNEALDRRSDVFSLAVCLWEMLTGDQLFDGQSVYQVAYALEHKEIEPPSRLAGPLPDGLDDIVMAALARDLEVRTPTAAAFADQLDRVIAAVGGERLQTWTARELAPAHDKHRTWLAGVLNANATEPQPRGRPTGTVTAIGAIAHVEAGPTRPLAAIKPDEVATKIKTANPVRRARAPAVIGLVALAAVATAIYLATRPPAAISISHDAAIVVPRPDAVTLRRDAAIASPPSDAAIASPPPDAAIASPPPDAGHARPLPSPPHRDAGGAPPPPPADAATETAIATGTITVSSPGRYLDVLIDGQAFGPTPLIKHAFRAGDHEVVLRSPDSNESVLDRHVTVSPDTDVRITPPPPP